MHEGDFTPDGFAWIQCDDWQNSIIAFRLLGVQHKDEEVIVVCNFTPVPRDGYRLGVPKAGFYKEVFNSDAGIYGGANIGNIGGMYSQPVPAHGMKNSIAVAVPPLAAVMFSRKA